MYTNTLLCQSVSDRIEASIRDGTWAVNEKIPSERILAQQYHVSRTVIREAIKKLNEKKLIINRPGKGNYVSRPDNSTLTTQFKSLLNYHQIPIEDLIEAREELEVMIGRRAVKNITRTQLKEISALYRRMDDFLDDHQSFSRCDYDFHVKLAECSGNISLKMIFISLYTVTGNENYAAVTGTRQIREHAQREHAAILTALKRRSPRNLEQAIHRHMQCIRGHILP